MRGRTKPVHKRVNWVCDECGKTFELSPSRAKQNKRHFCSKSCLLKWQSSSIMGKKHPNWKGVTAICKECGKSFHTKPSRLKDGRGKFCAKKCLYQHQSKLMKTTRKGANNPAWVPKIKSICDNCGAELERTPNRLKKSTLHFCSNICQGEYTRGPNHHNWKEKQSGVCLHCGKTFLFNPSSSVGKFCCDECFYSSGMLRKSNHIIPNKLEQGLIELMERNNIPFKYVGDGGLIIKGKNPDFSDNNGKLIEVYGDYWHRNDDPQDRIKFFRNYGYDTLVLWEHELRGYDEEEIVCRIRDFMGKNLGTLAVDTEGNTRMLRA